MNYIKAINWIIEENECERMGTFTYTEFDNKPNEFIKYMFGKSAIFEPECTLQIDKFYLYAYEMKAGYKRPDAVVYTEDGIINLYIVEELD